MIYSMRQSLAEPKPLWEVLRLIYAPWILDNVWNVVNNILYHSYLPISLSHGKLQIIYNTFLFEGCGFITKDRFKIVVQRVLIYTT